MRLVETAFGRQFVTFRKGLRLIHFILLFVHPCPSYRSGLITRQAYVDFRPSFFLLDLIESSKSAEVASNLFIVIKLGSPDSKVLTQVS